MYYVFSREDSKQQLSKNERQKKMNKNSFIEKWKIIQGTEKNLKNKTLFLNKKFIGTLSKDITIGLQE